MDTPESLPGQMYLLAHDPARQRLTARSQLGLVLRAASLTDLYLDGRLADVDGKPRATGMRTTDPVLDDLFQEIAESRPRSWTHWVGRRGRAAVRAVQEQLEDKRIIGVERYRRLGIFPVTRVTVREPRMVDHLRETVARVLRGETLAYRVEPKDAALVALAVAGEVRIAVSRRQAREHKQLIAKLKEMAGPAVPALHRALQQSRAAAASAG